MKASIKRKGYNGEMDKQRKRGEEEQYSKNISLCLCLSSTNPFVAVFYIGNIIGQ
jgi:threonine/homoserine/homoserine lactone efflux protein